MSQQLDQLPQVATPLTGDIAVIWRNGTTYGIPALALGVGIINPPYYYNVKASPFNAYGDGTHDDKTAIQQALNAAAETGGTVFFPQGTYLVSSALLASGNTTLLGINKNASIIQMASGSPIALLIGGGSSDYLYVQNLGFVGNGTVPAPPPNAPTIITFTGDHCGVYNCAFSANVGDTIDFLGCTDGEVAGCTFNEVGYNGAGASNALATPAVYTDEFSSNIKVHHNTFTNVQYHCAVFIGTDCEFSFNYAKNTYVNGIRIGLGSGGNVGWGNGSRVAFNRFDTVHQVGSTGGTAIYAAWASNLEVIGNIVSTTDNDGLAFAGCSNSVVSLNTAYNCCQVGGDCGIQYNPQTNAGITNVGMVFTGNTIYDNQATPTMTCGIRCLGPGTSNTAVILGNSFNGFTGSVGGNPQRGINSTDEVLDPDSNVVAWNTDWLDRQHLGSESTVPASTTATDVGTPSGSVLYSATIEKGLLGLQRGLRVTAYGLTTGTTANIHLLLSFGQAGGSALGNWLAYTIASPVNNAQWQIVAQLVNGGTNNHQRVMVQLYYNGALVVASNIDTLNVDTTVDQFVTLQATTPAGDTVVCQAFNLERI